MLGRREQGWSLAECISIKGKSFARQVLIPYLIISRHLALKIPRDFILRYSAAIVNDIIWSNKGIQNHQRPKEFRRKRV